MTLRITRVPHDATVRLEGRLGAEEVPELQRSVEAGVRVLDLQDLVSVDDEGLQALRGLGARGVEIRNASRYLRLRLA
jgi:hypothetical protein